MCRSIVRLREGADIAPTEDIEAAARQFVRKVSGFSRPARHNQEVFDQAVAEITDSVERLMAGLQVRGAQ
jgi:hypothetical protein